MPQRSRAQSSGSKFLVKILSPLSRAKRMRANERPEEKPGPKYARTRISAGAPAGFARNNSPPGLEPGKAREKRFTS
ncbi:hypothetical protein GOBAR_AA29427 [Gossypium barbadense]|uniref:Uncharacterized protein n=1 Tax=Gossypium barbadense TaxID=3634 RepID=A0A2P5WJK2_GOSBA|nr:hypothetical protein GOBAR_AA29427 [Gossypium barbadense]